MSRHTLDFYARSHALTVLAEPPTIARNTNFHADVTAIYGAKAVRRWIVDPADSD